MAKRRRGPIQVVKSTGEIEVFDERKLRHSLKRTGATPQAVERILEHVLAELEPGMSTTKIYSLAHRMLRRESRPLAGRYGLRRGIMSLGPSGFSFERFIAAALVAESYGTRTNVTLKGRCVSHEIDVLAKRDGEIVGIECKYHSRMTSKPDLKTALYVNARGMDLKAAGSVTDFWLVTNTQFTTEAERYAKCAGLTLRALDHPPGFSLRELIEAESLYPVTCLTTLKKRQIRALLDNGIVIGRQLVDHPDQLERLGLDESTIDEVLREVHSLPRKLNGPTHRNERRR